MAKTLLKIEDLHAGLESGQEIIRGIDLVVRTGETHVLMGPNGAGKSTLAHVVMGNPEYTVTQGQIVFDGEDITEAKTDERARKGLFLSFQSPEEVEGITVEDFLRTASTAISGVSARSFAFRKFLDEKMRILGMNESYAKRYLNVGFSGGEKKKNEILQMLALEPKLAILDETDSGLDVDAVKTVTQGVRGYKTADNALVVISHSAKLLENLEVDYVHILVDGMIVQTGSRSLIDTVNRDGFGAFLDAR